MMAGISKREFLKIVKPNGNFVHIEMSIKENREDLINLKEIIELGRLKPAIDRTYNLEQIVEAHRYVEKGHKKGNVVVVI
jgi:NADPH:quinone reductase-like Zn-dependent oxidoreductase